MHRMTLLFALAGTACVTTDQEATRAHEVDQPRVEESYRVPLGTTSVCFAQEFAYEPIANPWPGGPVEALDCFVAISNADETEQSLTGSCDGDSDCMRAVVMAPGCPPERPHLLEYLADYQAAPLDAPDHALFACH
ncbi:MAG: hypothetical protein H6Q90_2324 [Deltaproteobacteria bacterium]|nr:hypothetical protein [Deltaproteobacteria bacterium]